ncbi:MAG: hypothetical protein GY856_27820, partial [bacterium]|nr:hypothetical protein [bacterium]
NIAPTVDAGADRTITEVTAVNVAASFTDPGTLDTHTATIDWGDGTVGDADVAGGTVAGSHVYPDPGVYLVAVCVSDDDGGRGCGGFALTAIYEPDLVAAAVDTSAVTTDRQTLEVAGTVAARIRNLGSAATDSGFAVLFFADRNASGDYEPQPDVVLAEAVVADPLAAKAEIRVSAALSYTAAFGGNLIHVLVDSRHVVNERNENNNLHHSGFACGLAGLGGPAKDLGDLDAVLEWSWTGSPVEPTFNQVIMTPAVADLTGDGIPDLIFNTREDLGGTSYRPGVLRAIRGDGGGPLFDLADPALRTESPTHVAIGDLDGDGWPEIVAMLQWAGIVVLEHTGEVKWTLSGVDSGSYGGPTIANVDGEGLPEIVVGAWVVNADGTFHSSQRRNAGRGLVSVADLDLDGALEIVGGNQA